MPSFLADSSNCSLGGNICGRSEFWSQISVSKLNSKAPGMKAEGDSIESPLGLCFIVASRTIKSGLFKF